MNSLLTNLKGYGKECVLAPLLKMLEAVFELCVPLVVASIIDNGIAFADKPYIVKMGLLLLVLALVGLISSITAQYFSAKAAVGFATKERQSLFDHIQKFSYSQIDKLGTSTLINRITSDMNQVQNGINMTLRLFLRSPIIVFGAMIMAFTIDTSSALTFVVAIPLLAVIVFSIILSCIPLYRKVQIKLDSVLKHTRENLTGARVIRAFNKEEQEIADFEKSNSDLTHMQKFVGKLSALMNPLTYVIVNAAIMVLIGVGAFKVNIGTLSQGQVIALVNYMSQILVELIKLANAVILLTKSIACQKRIQTVFDIEIEPETAESVSVKELNESPIISFENVGFAYQEASEEALTDISFSVAKGETIGIIGGTGTGKTSLISLIPRFYKASRGKIKFAGNDISAYSAEELHDKIAVVPQRAVLFKGTIADNLRFGKQDATEEEMNEALKISQAKEFVDKKEGKLDFFVEQGGQNLSGGQKQRLTIARAVVKKPEILILDDSASALDFATDLKLRKAIANMENAPTTFIVSQRISSIQFADKILVLDDGKIVGQGTHNELLNSCEIYKEIYESQTKQNTAGGTQNVKKEK